MILWGAIGATLVTLALGGALTEIGPWYYRLSVPRWKPPNWAFAPIWSTIGVASAAAAVMSLRAAGPSARATLVGLFGLNMVLNVLWSALFFKAQRPDLALIEVVALWLSVLALVIAAWLVAPRAGLLLLPYLVWVGVAAALNRDIVNRNPPFAGRARRQTVPEPGDEP